jgi:hypothetical protein
VANKSSESGVDCEQADQIIVKSRYSGCMPSSNFEERVQKRLANSLRLRRYAMTLSAVLLVLGIAFALAEGDSKAYIAILWLLILLAGCIPMLVSLKRRRSVVLWIRRFHRGEQSRIEQQFLEGAVNPWGRLVTLADSNIHSASGSRSAIWLAVIMGGGGVLAAALGLLKPETVYFSLGFAGFLAWNWTRKGRAGFKSDNWTKKLATLKKSRSVVAAGLSGVVLNCPPDTDRWRDVIQSLAPVVDAAVISVPENTPQIEWELATLRASLGPGKIIVLTSDGTPPAVDMEMLQVIQAPKPVSWWHDYRVSYFGPAWTSAMRTVLRAIESGRALP